MTLTGRKAMAALAAALGILAFASAVGVAAAEAKRPPQGLMGVTASNLRNPELMDRFGRGGANMARLQIIWEYVEPEPGDRNWGPVDTVVRRAAMADLNVLALVYSVPDWVARNPAKAPIYKASQRSAYRRFLRDLVRRYGPGGSFWTLNPLLPYRPIKVWEIGNEPNLKLFWGGRPSPRGEARLLKIAANAIRGVDPQAQILTGGLFVLGKSKGRASLKSFLTELYRIKRARRYFDGVAIHPYSRRPSGVLDWTRLTRGVMDRAGDRRARIYITEVGWTTGGELFKESPYRATFRQQRKWLKGTYLLLGRHSRGLNLKKVMWHTGQDMSVPGPDYWIYRMGLFHLDGSPKPAWRAFVNLAGGSF